jgi:DMSO/TMAO reductase YedYZ molybdopterin-dependent catalytic subunit
MTETPSLGSRYALALRTLLAGIAGVAGSYALAGSTPSFVAAPIESWLAATVPDYLLRVAITVVTPLGKAVGIAHLGQALNLTLAIALGVGLVGALALAALLTGRMRGDATVTVALALSLPAIAVLVLTASATSALGAGLGSAVVVALGEFARMDAPATDAGRRDLLGSLAGALAVGLGGAFLGSRSSGSDGTETPRPLAGSGADVSNTDASGPNTTGEGTAAGEENETNSDSNDPGEIERLLATAEKRSLSIPNLEGLVSGADFYEVDINSIDPDVNAEDWTLLITGAVSNVIEIGYDDLRSMDAEHRFTTLRCVSDSLNGSEMDTALWTGVPIADILARAGARGRHLQIDAADDYFQGFPIGELDDAMLVYGMDGTTLLRGHGAPVRLLVPGHWGEIQVKWITGIEVLNQPIEGFWEQRGWHGTGDAHTVAKLQATNRQPDGRIQVAGHAYAGTRGIERVEVSIDGSEWRETDLSKPLPASTGERARGLDGAGAAWRQWAYTYDSPGTDHEVRVRTIEADGTIQPRESADPYPHGATGWVSVTVER